MERLPRLAYFPDTYEEIDGVANTSRQLKTFAKKRGFPLLIFCGGYHDQAQTDGSTVRVMLCRGPIRFPLDKKHDFDLLFWRYYRYVKDAVRRFAPDVVHITGPSDVGLLGALVAHRLGIPLVASWHTNLHEYAERRALPLLGVLPANLSSRLGANIRELSLSLLLNFYKRPQILFAPNPELVDLLAAGTGRPVHLMRRGVDPALFAPERRDRTDTEFTIGYVGRLTVEKNIWHLPEIERSLVESGLTNFRFLVVGQGAEEPWLRANLRHAEFAGVLKGEALARAYANMDVFVFPSDTETFGNVVLEALASGVPAIVTDLGGPRFIVRHGETGFIGRDVGDFAHWIFHLSDNPQELQRMRQAAREEALQASWDAIFAAVYAAYPNKVQSGSATPGRVELSRQPVSSVPS